MEQTSETVNIVLLSGGSGTRLWPLSNETRSKQFLKVLRDDKGNPQSMVQRTFEQISHSPIDSNILIATCASQVATIESQIKGDYSIVVEPERRDTAPAIMLAAMHLALKQNANSDETVIVMPIDAFVEQEYYNKLSDIHALVQESISDMVLLGVHPTYPSEKYGYIVPEGEGDISRKVARFVEKPNMSEASSLIDQGALWNCGVFGFKLSYLLDVVSQYCDYDDFETFRSNYSKLPKKSFDYEVVEEARSIVVVPYDGVWKDLGTWNTLTDEMGERLSGRVVVDDTCENIHVINETGLPMVVAGVKDVVAIATPDGLLVSDKDSSADIKKYIEAAAETRPMYESRQWGEYKVLEQSVSYEGMNTLVKVLNIAQGCQLSYQCHAFRDEIWTIAGGHGHVVVDDVVMPISAGSVIKINRGQKHAIRATEELLIYEVQLGQKLEETDIERFGFFWQSDDV